jgi:predicted amidophosphoribosyltransferase
MTFAADGRFARRCVGCSFAAWPKPEWDESPQPSYCPSCGLPLERLACRECGEPLLVHGNMYGGSEVAKCCTACGAAADPPEEPRLRTRPNRFRLP